jgi:hypothetical protein
MWLQIELARVERGSSAFPMPLVILANNAKEAMDAELEVEKMAARGLMVGWGLDGFGVEGVSSGGGGGSVGGV